ncbi:hypothetical protein [Rhizobium oryzicola]|uniref:Uncharacterized protein n=1 Tax=Rhizobium oryzicola TaxID=1232668 RepID=A0ABT8SVY6_9HYPH|nr:hypothetical protein [Rhizobium oryzicola]MDO1582614.1 hypothetical protein [Rhizobium oryzicola]
MQIAKISLKRLASHVPLCRVTLVVLFLLGATIGFAFSSVEVPQSLQALLLTAGLLGTIFGIGRKHRVVYSELGENA